MEVDYTGAENAIAMALAEHKIDKNVSFKVIKEGKVDVVQIEFDQIVTPGLKEQINEVIGTAAKPFGLTISTEAT